LNVLGSVVLDFTTNRLDLQFLDSAGVVRDTFAIEKPSEPPGPPAAPTGLAASAGDNQVALSWNTVAEATSYTVKRATVSGGPYTTIAAGVATTAFTDTTALNGITYFYVVSAVNVFGESPNSNEVSATPSAPTAPNPPSALTAKASGKKKVNLSWTQSNSPGLTANRIYRATASNGTYNLIATISPNTSFNNTGLVSGTTYFYRVTAVNGSGLESASSNTASATAR
jgi:fibronectin type 3 domain-containing protein